MSELTEILKETVHRLFSELVTRKLQENAEVGKWPDGLWDTIAENGLIHPLVSDKNGGAGASFSDTYEIIFAAGYHAAPLPLPETILASWLADISGIQIPKGPLTVL